MNMHGNTRRAFLKTVGLGAATAVVPSGVFAADNPTARLDRRPNILWISCEDVSPLLGCYGDPNAVTPTLDRLAAQGTRFDNAFTHAGVCAPVRSGTITGMYPSTLGSQHMRCNITLPPEVNCFTTYLREAGYYCTNNVKQDYNFTAPESAWDESSGKAHWRNRPAGRPFFAVRNFTGTHESKVRASVEQHAKATERLKPSERQDPAKLTLPPYYPDTPATRRDWAQNYELITALDYDVADMLDELEEAGLADDTIVFFWSDHGVGLPRAKRWLYDSGTHVPLIVRIPEKFRVNGQGRPGTVDDRLVAFVDLAPTVLNLAGVDIPGHMQGQPFLGPNLPPPRRYVYGARDRMDERYDLIRSVRDKRYRYIRNYEPFKPYYQYMDYAERGPTMQELRRLHASGDLPPAAELFMASSKPVEELYDLETDPHEIDNLAGKPEYRDVLERMRAAHIEWMIETRDVGLLPEPELVERAKKYGSRYAILRQPGSEQFMRRLRAVAARAGRPARTDRRALARAMKDEDAAVRYWGAIGLGNLGKDVESPADLLAEGLNDPSAVVRVAAARGLCRMGMEQKALPVLERELKSEHEWIRLMAALVLDSIGDKARPAIDALKEAMKDKQNKYVVRVANHALNVMLGTDTKVQ